MSHKPVLLISTAIFRREQIPKSLQGHPPHDVVMEAMVSSTPLANPAKLLSFKNMWISIPDCRVAAFLEDCCRNPSQKLPHFSCLVSAGGLSPDTMLFVTAHCTLRSEDIHQSRLDGLDTGEELSVDAIQEMCLICVQFWKEDVFCEHFSHWSYSSLLNSCFVCSGLDRKDQNQKKCQLLFCYKLPRWFVTKFVCGVREMIHLDPPELGCA